MRRLGFRAITLWGVVLAIASTVSAVEAPRVLEFIIDPFNSDQAWMLTEPDLQFNPGLKARAHWAVRFNRRIFESVAKVSGEDSYRHLKLSLSHTHPGTIFLWVETTDGSTRQRYLLKSADWGRAWTVQNTTVRAPPVARAVTPRADAESRSARVPAAVGKSAIEADGTTPPNPLMRYFGGGPGVTPLFKLYFDLLLDVRPEATPLTFDTYHSLFLVDINPRPGMQFSFEVSPSPRFYELDYQVTPSLQLRGGRIWIPFDDLNPHNTFGGYINISNLMQPMGSAFLPNFWADLGLSAKYRLVNASALELTGELYVVNGFQSGGTDPKGQVAIYPDFSATPNVDDNTDKAVGLRLHALVQHRLGLGLSAYSGRYTPDRAPDRRITMLGADSQWQVTSGTLLRLGYIFMQVGLAPGGGATSFHRQGSYVDLRQELGGGWFFGLRGGMTDGDDRVVNVDDQQIVGMRVGYQTELFQITLQHNQDLERLSVKKNYSFTALDFLLTL